MRVVLTAAAVAVCFVWSAACSIEGKSDDDGNGGGQTVVEPGPTEVCEEMCVPLHAAGEAEYRTLRACLLCNACSSVCETDAAAVCADAMVQATDACSSLAPDCASCVVSPCAVEQQPDTSFVGVCAAEATACQANVPCISLNNCVANCVANTPGTGGAGP